MQISYSRQSKDTFATITKRVSDVFEKHGLHVLQAESLKDTKGMLFYFQKRSWTEEVVRNENQVIGLLPALLLVEEKGGKVSVGVLDAGILGQVAQTPDVKRLAAEVDRTMTEIVEESAGVGKLQPKEVKLYVTTTCPYCKMEEAWLKEKHVPFSLVHIDLSPDAAQEMVEKTGQMGVPVTEITYEDRESEYLIGFDKPRLAKILSL